MFVTGGDDCPATGDIVKLDQHWSGAAALGLDLGTDRLGARRVAADDQDAGGAGTRETQGNGGANPLGSSGHDEDLFACQFSGHR
jgi:hypothetical protein